jgi:hypothetical protein
MMDKILQEATDQAYEAARLRRNSVRPTRDLVFAEMLADLEASGMQYVSWMARAGLPGRRHPAFSGT